MLVCVDHGNKQIKTASRVFTSGLVESDTRPPFGDNILFYRGKYYTLSDQRIPYTRDKTEDDRFFILTLFAIAYEINTAGQYIPDRLMNIQLAVGLPPAHYGTQYKRFAQYFLNRGVIGFEFNGRKYSICITEAVCFPQALAATAPVFKRLQLGTVAKATVIDIGGFTADYLSLRYGAADWASCAIRWKTASLHSITDCCPRFVPTMICCWRKRTLTPFLQVAVQSTAVRSKHW